MANTDNFGKILSVDKDIELAKRMSKKWHDSKPASKFHMIEDAGHYANRDDPDSFNRIVMGFIKQASGQAHICTNGSTLPGNDH